MRNEGLFMLHIWKISGFPGGDIHDKIVERMKKVLQEDTVYTYLQPKAQRLLSDARKYARENGLLTSKVLPSRENSFFYLPMVWNKKNQNNS